jgi:uncharacterized protein (TIGR02145 family)
MQDFTTADCQALGGNTTPTISTTDYTPYTTTLIDIRDDREYRVRKLADGKCWMIDNLMLELQQDMELIPDTTNVGSDTTVTLATGGRNDNFTTSNYLTVNNGNSTASPNLDAWRQVDPSNTTSCLNESAYNPNSKTGCGYLYNFYTATAGSAPQSQTSGKANYSICPSSWKLPSGLDENGDFGFLSIKYGGTGSYQSGAPEVLTKLWQSAGVWQGAFSGYYDSKIGGQGSIALYWSSSVYSATHSYVMRFESSIVYPVTSYDDRYDGYAVRCLVK